LAVATDLIIDTARTKPELGGPEFDQLARQFLDGPVTFAAPIRANLAISTGPQTSETPVSAKPSAVSRKAQPPLLLEAADKYRHDRFRDGKSTDREGRAAKEAITLLARICGDKRVDLFSRADLEEYLDALRRLPKNHGKSPRLRAMSIAEVIKEGEAKRLPTLQPQTIFKHATQLQAFFGALVDKEMVKRNPASGIYKKPKPQLRDKDKTRAWTDAEVETLFASPVWTGMQNHVRCTHPGAVIVQDGRYWVPLLLAFQGARLNEVCQLLVSDIKSEQSDGADIPYLHITDASGNDAPKERQQRKRLKNLMSRRKVPIHTALIDLGFLKHVEKQRNKGAERLFPELPISSRGLFSSALSKWFSRSGGYRDQTGLASDLKLHGLRHTVITKLAHAGVNREVINQIVGHAGAGMGERVYTKDRGLPEIKVAIEAIDFPGLDIARLRAQVDEAMKR
jgi:integrase